jgi:lipopolysaccharide transport system ATP-binding protein
VDANYEWQDNLLAFDVVNADRPMFIGSSWIASTISISMPEAGTGKKSVSDDAQRLAG